MLLTTSSIAASAPPPSGVRAPRRARAASMGPNPSPLAHLRVALERQPLLAHGAGLRSCRGSRGEQRRSSKKADLRALATVDRDLDRYTFVGGASIYPFCWNILLAARERGLGGVMTTMPVYREPDVLDLMNAPEGFALATLMVMGEPSLGSLKKTFLLAF